MILLQIGDLISREETLTAFSDYVASGMSMDDFGALWNIVVKMPPANPWIPVSERLPKAYQKVLVTYEEFHWANEPATYGVKLIPFGGRVDFIGLMPSFLLVRSSWLPWVRHKHLSAIGENSSTALANCSIG